jgi:hypothetical protein
MISTNRTKRKQRSRILLGATVRAETLESRCMLSTTPGFSAPVSYNIGTQADGFVPNAVPSDVVSADITGDGKTDLIVAHTADNSVYFLKGNGNGTFQPAVQIPVGQAIQGDVFVGDFNNDGKPDLLLITSNLDQPIVMLGNGDGTFQPAKTSSSFAYPGYYPRGWTVGDFNGDGKLDIACTLPSETTNTGRYEVLLGNGDGTFKPAIVGPAVLGYSRGITTGDFNHDGKLDLAIADGQGTSGNTANVELTILLGNGDGTFTLGAHYASPQFPDGTDTAAVSNPEDVVVADVNNDGNLDVIESDYDNTINVFLGNGNGTFQAARSFDPGNYPRDVIPVDVNHDGKIDLVVTNVGINTGGALQSTDGDEPGSVAVLLGNGDGTFQAPITYSPSVYPGWTAVGDFNGDGYPDLATSEVLNGHAVNVMLDQPTSTNLPPAYVDPPSASPLTVTNNTTTLSALASDDGGESNLTYTWATVGSIPGPVTYSINGTNASKNTVATFTTPGTYLFQCAATDVQGLSIMDLVTVTVNAATTTLAAPTATGPGSTSTPIPVLTTNTPTFAWSAVAGVTGYQINLHNNTTSTTASYSVGASLTSYTLAAGVLIAGDSYVWNVRGLNGPQSGPPSANLSFQAQAATTSPPAVTGVTPSSGSTAGGTSVTISGTNFTGISTVRLGTVNAASFTVNSPTSITATAPAEGAGTVDVLVSGTAGTSSAATSDHFTFVAATLPTPTILTPGTTTTPGPMVSSLTPTFTWTPVTATAGITGYQLNLYDSTLKKSYSYQITGVTTASFTIPTSAPLTAGDSFVWNLRVVTSATTGPESAYFNFQTTPAAPAPPVTSPPQITTVSPASGSTAGGTSVTISGTNFTGISTVRFGTVNAASFTVNSPTSITATAPAESAGTVDVLVSGTGGSSSAATADHFAFVAPTLPTPTILTPGTTTTPGPMVSSLTPTFTWTPVTAAAGITGYQLNLYDSTLKKSYSYQITGVSTASFTIPTSAPLTAGDSFVWNLRVVTSGTTGPESAYFNFQTATASSPPTMTTTPSVSAITPALSGKLPTTAITGNSISLHQTVTLTNTAAATVKGATSGVLYLSSGDTLDPNAIPLVNSRKSIKLKARKHATFTIALNHLPADVPNGVYHLVMQITDPDGVTSSAASVGTITVARP